MDSDLDSRSRDELVVELVRLRNAVRAHRDSSGHELCWHHPALWNLLPEHAAAPPQVPDWPQFMRGCIRYRASPDEQLPDAPRTCEESPDAASTIDAASTTGAAIKQVRGVPVNPVHRASCHCGAVQLELQLPDGIVDPRRCDCSICRRKGAVVASVPLAGLRVVRGAEHLKLYQFGTHVARHYFCGHCGIYTHHQRRSNPDQYGYNVGCLEGINPLAIADVPISNGVHHPSDRGTPHA